MFHVSINTFVGFPSREKNTRSKKNHLSSKNGMGKFKFIELQRIIDDPNYVYNYDLIHDSFGILSSQTMMPIIVMRLKRFQNKINIYKIIIW